jgi:hypothetical protein
MCERAKEKSLIVIRLLDGMRHQLSWYLCKLTVVLSESIFNEDDTLTQQFIDSCVRMIHTIYAARVRVIRNFFEAYPEAPFNEAEEDYLPQDQANLGPPGRH